VTRNVGACEAGRVKVFNPGSGPQIHPSVNQPDQKLAAHLEDRERLGCSMISISPRIASREASAVWPAPASAVFQGVAARPIIRKGADRAASI
jgi:hypothetical protein